MTNRILLAAVVLAVMPLVTNTARAAGPKDPYGPRGSWTTLLKNKAVQKELVLTEEQQTFANSLKRAKDDNVGKIEKTLDAGQRKRLKQLSWQVRGGYVLFDDDVAEALKITADQKDKLAAAAKINEAEHAKMRDFLRRARFRSREAMQKFIAGYRNAADKRLLDVLTEAQTKSLDALLGKRLTIS